MVNLCEKITKFVIVLWKSKWKWVITCKCWNRDSVLYILLNLYFHPRSADTGEVAKWATRVRPASTSWKRPRLRNLKPGHKPHNLTSQDCPYPHRQGYPQALWDPSRLPRKPEPHTFKCSINLCNTRALWTSSLERYCNVVMPCFSKLTHKHPRSLPVFAIRLNNIERPSKTSQISWQHASAIKSK